MHTFVQFVYLYKFLYPNYLSGFSSFLVTTFHVPFYGVNTQCPAACKFIEGRLPEALFPQCMARDLRGKRVN